MVEDYYRDKLDRIDTNVTRLLERQEYDSETLEDHEGRLRTLERWFYRAALPAGGVGVAGVIVDLLTKWLA